MKNTTIVKDLKFNGSRLTLEYKKEVLYKFNGDTVLDLYNIEHCIGILKNSLTISDKNKFKDVVNHTIKHLENGFVITIDSMFQRDNFPITHKIHFATLVKNNVIYVG